MPLLNLNRTHAPSEGDGRTIHDNIYIYIYIYTDSAGVEWTRRGSLRLAPIMFKCVELVLIRLTPIVQCMYIYTYICT